MHVFPFDWDIYLSESVPAWSAEHQKKDKNHLVSLHCMRTYIYIYISKRPLCKRCEILLRYVQQPKEVTVNKSCLVVEEVHLQLLCGQVFYALALLCPILFLLCL